MAEPSRMSPPKRMKVDTMSLTCLKPSWAAASTVANSIAKNSATRPTVAEALVVLKAWARPTRSGRVSKPSVASRLASSWLANDATSQVTTRIRPAAMMCGTAASIMPSMSVAGFDIASIFSASSAAISEGRNTATNTSMPSTADGFTVSFSPARPPSRSMPAVRLRWVVMLRSTVATIQPTAPMMKAPSALGSMSSVLVTMALSGSSRPSICSAPRMAGTNSRITSQNSAPERLSLIGDMSACSDSFSSSVVLSSSFCDSARTTLATSQPTSASTRPPNTRGA